MKVNTIDDVSYKGFQFSNKNSVSKVAEKLSLERANDVEFVINVIKEQKNNPDTIMLDVYGGTIIAENIQKGSKNFYEPIFNTVTNFFRELIEKTGQKSEVHVYDYGHGKKHFYKNEIVEKLEDAVK